VHHGGSARQGGGGSARERWVNSVGRTRAEAATLVDDEPRKVAGVTGNRSYSSGRRRRGLGVDQTKEKGRFAWCSPDGGGEMAVVVAPNLAREGRLSDD
jgi:hypothetical protein